MTLLLFLLFFLLIFLSVPISTVLSFLSTLPSLMIQGFPASVPYIIRSMIGGSDSFLLLAIPMFILSGVIMTRGGISKKLFEIFGYFFGKYKSGLPIAAIVTCLFYGAISGSAPATTAAVGSMLIPILVELGYEKSLVTAMIATAGGLGVIIPPSIPFILYGNATETSVADMFIAGIIPGICIALGLIVVTIYIIHNSDFDFTQKDIYIKELKQKGFLKILKNGIWALLAPIIILGSIYGGFASPTESAVISVIYALFVSLVIYKTVKIKDLKTIFYESIKIYAPLLFVLCSALAFSRILAILQVPQQLGNWVESYLVSKWTVLLVIHLVLLFVGMVMDTSAAILVLAPILLPIVERFGIHPIHFGMMMVVNLAIGFVTPPIGVNLFVASGISNLSVDHLARKALPYIVSFLIVLLMITLVPYLSLVFVY